MNEYLRRHGIKFSNGTIVDGSIVHASIVNAPSSTKNNDGKRNPEMHQTAKGKKWNFGMKAHIGVDRRTKLIRTELVLPARALFSRTTFHMDAGVFSLDAFLRRRTIT